MCEHRFSTSSYLPVRRCGERANPKIILSRRPPCAGERRVLNHQKFTDPCGGLSNSPNPVLSCCGLAAPLGTAIQAVPVMPSLSRRRLTSISNTVVRCAPGVLLGGASASLAATRRGAIISTSMPSRLCREASSSAAATRRRRNPVVLCLLRSPAGARGRKTNSYQLSRPFHTTRTTLVAAATRVVLVVWKGVPVAVWATAHEGEL